MNRKCDGCVANASRLSCQSPESIFPAFPGSIPVPSSLNRVSSHHCSVALSTQLQGKEHQEGSSTPPNITVFPGWQHQTVSKLARPFGRVCRLLYRDVDNYFLRTHVGGRGDEEEGREQTHKQSGHRETAASAARFHSNSHSTLEEQLMSRSMLTRAILAHFLRLANFKRSRRSSAVVRLVSVQHLAMAVRHQAKAGLFPPNL